MASELAQDGTVIVSTLANPARGFVRAVARQRALTAVIVATTLSLLATALILPSLDAEAVASSALRPDMTPHERTEAIASATKLHEVTTWAAAAVTPTTSAFLLTVALWLGFWAAGARTGFKTTFTVSAHALIPQGLKALLTVPAVLVHAPVTPDQLPRLLPSNLAAVLPVGVTLSTPALAVASALDLFSLWTLLLIGAGMRKASGASPVRTRVVLLVLFAAYLALFKVVPSASPRGGP